jgi:alpha-mannosidase
VLSALDYLEFKPERQEELSGLAGDGKILAGPWFVQPDLFLSSGEVIVRNLLEGTRAATALGSCLKCLYIPESSGIISQAPQIMRGFGIEHLVFIRGIGDERISSEYMMEGPDGSMAVATYLVNAYNNGGFLPGDPRAAVERIHREADSLKADGATRWLLINQGGDHYPPQLFLQQVIELLRQSGRYQRVEAGSFQDYLNLARAEIAPEKLHLIEGELRGSRHYPILSGKISSRMDMKIASEALIDRVITLAEPLAVMQMAQGRSYPEAIFKRIWNLLLQNQHHNTAGGTVTDGVYAEALLRLEKVRELLDEEWCRSARFMAGDASAPMASGTPLIVLNTSPFPRSGPVVFRLENPVGSGVRVLDEKGQAVPCQVIAPGEGDSPAEVMIIAEKVPGMGQGVYYAEAGDVREMAPSPIPTISNEFFQAGFEDKGTFFIRDLKSGQVFGGLSRFTDEADAGDLYNFSPVPGDFTLANAAEKLEVEAGPGGDLQKSLRLKGRLNLPRSLTPDRRGRTREWVSCPYTLWLGLAKGVPWVECVLTLENCAMDHRLRVTFPTPSKSDFVRAGQPFHILERPVRPPAGEGWIEAPSPAQPFRGILEMPGGGGSMAILSRDITEYEIFQTPGGNEMRLTVLRSVGWLSRGDCITRRVSVAPQTPTPRAQCQEKLTVAYAVAPWHQERDLCQLASLYQEYRAPLLGVPLPAGIRQETGPGLFEISPSCLCISACKKMSQGESVMVRFYNPTGEVIKAGLKSGGKLEKWRKTGMGEESDRPFQALPAQLDLRPFEIVTLELAWPDS